MPQPRSDRSTRRDDIVREAARLFAHRGFHGASLRDLASACGIRQPSLYNHFPSKDAILAAVIDRYFDVLLPELAAAGAVDGDGAARLTAMIETSVVVGTKHRDVFLATSNNWEIVRDTPALAAVHARRDEAMAQWRLVLRAGAADGSLRPMEPYHALWVISSAVTGMIDMRYAAPGEIAPPIDALVTILVEGLAGPRAGS